MIIIVVLSNCSIFIRLPDHFLLIRILPLTGNCCYDDHDKYRVLFMFSSA